MTTPRLKDLGEIEAAIWRELALAVHDPGHGWRVAVLATTDGQAADARSVVLREFDPATRTLLIYADSRSPKARQIEAFPGGTLVLWSQALGWQLRLRVALQMRSEGLGVSSRWARLKLTPAAQDYLSPLPPGTMLEAPAPAHVPARESRGHFAVLAAVIQRIDWLELDARGHRRACFGESAGRWLAP